MDIISLLPDSVANQIAAGEVIQRPASVIKELVENAVDAGAKVINVLVTDSGRTSIQVIDDGRGMSETDARLAFERHATSKIRQADDLFALHTMGFRGEALPSIAAVAQVELTTRMADEQLGTHLSIAASKVVSQEPVACPVGSNFRVENLFYNVPARRKFLKSNATELCNIMTAFERIALVYPDIAFTLHSRSSQGGKQHPDNGTEVLNLKAASLRQRITDVFGKRFNQDILPVEVDTALCRITGFVGKPETAKKKGSHEYFFVNGRYMKHAYFHKAVISAYDRLIPDGTHVPYFIYFEVNPADIDVNIHPTKTEIKFENEQPIWQILTAAVRDAIGRFCEVPTIEFDTEGRPDIPVFDPTRDNIASPRVNYNPAYNPFSPSSSRGSSSSLSSPSVPSSSCTSSVPVGFPGEIPALEKPSPTSVPVGSPGEIPAPDGPSPTSVPVGFPDGIPSPLSPNAGSTAAYPTVDTPSENTLFALSDRSPVHYQYKGRYIMTAVKSGLMIIDQYRASLRIQYEHFSNRQSTESALSQQVLFPETIQLSPVEYVSFRDQFDNLQSLGFDFSDLGGNTIVVNGVPADISGVSLPPLIHDLLSPFTPHPSSFTPHLLTLARSAAIPYGQVLSNEEMENVVNQLFTCSNVNYTPDGKAILCILPQHDIEQLLG